MAAASPRALRFFSIPFILFGVIGLGFGIRDIVQGIRSGQWPHVDGVVESAEMVTHHHTGRHGGGTTFAAVIHYDYQVAGTKYPGSRVCYGGYESSAAHAQAIIDRYP